MRVVDGDTVLIGETSVRLYGIDAPETDQHCGGEGAPVWPCGAWTTGEVRARYDGRHAACEALDRDRYGRVVARCVVDGEDMAAALVRGGLAFAYLSYSDDYAGAERAAAEGRRGLHAVGVQSPAAFRAALRRTQMIWNARTAPEGCAIKGNVSQSGERIYHVPGQHYYQDTKITGSKGERWFCSEAEAVSAGWRRAKT